MKPHSGDGGETPRPRNERLAAITIESPTRPEAYTKIGLKMLARICVRMIVGVLAPVSRAASMNSETRTRLVAASATRARGAM